MVPRFVRYTSEFDSYEEDNDQTDHDGSETCHIILRLLRDHLVKARTLPLDSSGSVVTERDGKTGESIKKYDDPRVVKLTTVEVGDLPRSEDRQRFVNKQHTLMKHGCVELMARIMMSQDTAEDGDLADEALEVLGELQHGGNLKVRKSLYDLLSKEDMEGRFLLHLTGRMLASNAKLNEAKSFGLLGASGAHLTEDIRAAIANARQSIQFFTHLCVGHHKEFQDILREQPFYNAQTYDLVNKNNEFARCVFFNLLPRIGVLRALNWVFTDT